MCKAVAPPELSCNTWFVVCIGGRLARVANSASDSACCCRRSATIRSRSLSNFAASRCRAARISSVGVNGSIAHPFDFFRSTNDWRLIASITTNAIDALAKCRIGDMLEVPRHQVLYAMHGRNSNVQCVSGLRCGDGLSLHQCVRQVFRSVGDVESSDAHKFIEAFLSRLRIACKAFVNDKLRD